MSDEGHSDLHLDVGAQGAADGFEGGRAPFGLRALKLRLKVENRKSSQSLDSSQLPSCESSATFHLNCVGSMV